MNHTRFTTIAHRDHAHLNPIDPATLERATSDLGLGSGDPVLDVGCGKAALLVDLARRFGARGLGVDINAAFLAEGRALAGRAGVAHAVALVESEAAGLDLAPATFALGICIGSTHALGGYRETLRALRRLVRRDGHVLVGQGYWRRAPDAEYLERLEATADEMTSHEGNVAAGLEEGLREAGAWVSSLDDWDRYEGLYADTVEAYVAAHPEDRDAPAMGDRIRRWRETYWRWGRDTLGFGLYRFRVP
jgi:cyclopropane fatty-acyl-phospholipid synthase-like methyltransferase